MAIPDIMIGKLRIPVVASPLFIISNPDLVIAQCKAGVVGSFPSLNARPIEVLDEWLHGFQHFGGGTLGGPVKKPTSILFFSCCCS